jgi:hypothetical protein
MSQSRSSAWAKMVTACSVRIYVHLPLSNNVYNCHTHTLKHWRLSVSPPRNSQ